MGHYEGNQSRDSSRSHFGNDYNTFRAQNDNQTGVGNQSSQNIVHGDQRFYMNCNMSTQKAPVTSSTSLRSVVPPDTVQTYTERPELSDELARILSEPNGGTGLDHAVAVVGLGGTGKTQLVLRYVEGCKGQYDLVLYIDVQTESKARSSFELCCRELDCSFDPSNSDEPLQTLPAVQTLLQRLRSRPEDKKWLVILDNADKLSWSISSIIPRGKAGTVILTSQNASASLLLGGCTKQVKVDVMDQEQALVLLRQLIGVSQSRCSDCQSLLDDIATQLNRHPLALELAGARIRQAVCHGKNLETALSQWLIDYQRHQDRLLQDEKFAELRLYKKTVWTVWDTSLLSLHEAGKSVSGIYPIDLLSFATLLDRTNIQVELFRLAGLGLKDSCSQLRVDPPPWMQHLLGNEEGGEWDDTRYRDSLDLLLQYGFVKWVDSNCTGFTMHSLVQWRAGQEKGKVQLWRWYLIFMTAICFQLARQENIHFRQHAVVHFCTSTALLDWNTALQAERLWRAFTAIGNVFRLENRFAEAGKLQNFVVMENSRSLGEQHLDTLEAKSQLALTYSQQGLWKEAHDLDLQVFRQRKSVKKLLHPDTLTSMHHLAITKSKQRQWAAAIDLDTTVLALRRETLGHEHPDTIHVMSTLGLTRRKRREWKEAEALHVEAYETSLRTLGKFNLRTLASMSNLADTYLAQGRYREAETLELIGLEVRRNVFGDDHRNTVWSMADLAIAYSRQGLFAKAEALEVKVLETTRRLFGSDDWNTAMSMGNLALTYSKQSRWKEAEELQVKVLDAANRTFDDDDWDIIYSTINLARTFANLERWKEAEEYISRAMAASSRVTNHHHYLSQEIAVVMGEVYSKQSRWREAEALQSKTLETSSRVSGDKHPDTLDAMARLAHTKKGFRYHDIALDLMSQSAQASVEAIGEGHPDCIERHRYVVEWLSEGGLMSEGPDQI